MKRKKFIKSILAFSAMGTLGGFKIGGNVKLSDKLFLSATSDIEFNGTLLIVPRSYLSYSLLLGLFIDFN